MTATPTQIVTSQIKNSAVTNDKIDSGVSADKISDGVTNAAITLTQESNFESAYGWGDHASGGYFVTASDTLDDITDGSTYVKVSSTDVSNWNALVSESYVNVVSETVAGTKITAGVAHDLPGSATYFGDAPALVSTASYGKNLQVFINGELQDCGDTGFERDYKEVGSNLTGQTQVKFERDIEIGERIKYIIQKA